MGICGELFEFIVRKCVCVCVFPKLPSSKGSSQLRSEIIIKTAMKKVCLNEAAQMYTIHWAKLRQQPPDEQKDHQNLV